MKLLTSIGNVSRDLLENCMEEGERGEGRGGDIRSALWFLSEVPRRGISMKSIGLCLRIIMIVYGCRSRMQHVK